MYGRNGYDLLCYAALVLYILCVVVNLFVRSPIVNLVETLLALYIFFRVFSKNLYKRRAENAKFATLLNKIKPPFLLFASRIKEIRTHRYRKCPKCRSMLRLRRRTGKHTVVCPRCRNEFAVRILV
jgi:hypothetical protein